VFENRVLRRIFVPKMNEVTGGWRKLLNEELNNLYSLPSIISMLQSVRMREAGRVSQAGRRETHFTCGNVRSKETTRKTNIM
jgi:hypothetical protein